MHRHGDTHVGTSRIGSNRTSRRGGVRVSTSSVVFVGIGFERQLFNEHELFPEPMGRNYTALGQVGEYTYGTNETYRFIVLPNKVTLQHESETVLSDELMEAGEPSSRSNAVSEPRAWSDRSGIQLRYRVRSEQQRSVRSGILQELVQQRSDTTGDRLNLPR